MIVHTDLGYEMGNNNVGRGSQATIPINLHTKETSINIISSLYSLR